MAAVWCVKDRGGLWCAAADGYRPDDNVGCVNTACGDYVVLPHGIQKRHPTCSRCNQAIRALKGTEG